MIATISAVADLVQHLTGLLLDAVSLLRRAPSLTLEECQREIAAIRASAAGVSAADWNELREALRKVPTEPGT